MRVQHNIMAMNAYRNYNNNTKSLSGNLEKLSSGYKINRAGDDAAGLAISEKMRAQITGLNAAQKNVKDGISLVKTAEGAMQEIQDMLNRMDYLATQSANGTYDDEVDRKNLQKEVDALNSEITRIADSANFNGIKLMNGDLGGADVTGFTAAKSGIISASYTGGGVGVNGASKGGGVNFNLTSTGAFTFKNVSSIPGLSWELTGSNGETGSGTSITINLKPESFTGGTFTIKAKWDDTNTSALAVNKLYYEDMVITVNVGASATSTAFTKSTATAAMSFAAGAKGLDLQIGDTADSYNKLNVKIDNMSAASLGVASINIASQDGAADAIQVIKNAINKVSETRGDLGAIQNRLDHTANNLSVMAENIQDAESTIRDTDVAEEMMSYVKNNILVQSAQAMLAQANQVPQGVLQLLG